MSFVYYNANPVQNRTNDCAVRAIAVAENKSWLEVFDGICTSGRSLFAMPSTNEAWGEYLRKCGYIKRAIPNLCPNCYTVRDFCREHPRGKYVVGVEKHVVAIIDGDWYDTWDSGDEVPIFYWKKGA